MCIDISISERIIIKTVGSNPKVYPINNSIVSKKYLILLSEHETRKSYVEGLSNYGKVRVLFMIFCDWDWKTNEDSIVIKVIVEFKISFIYIYILSKVASNKIDFISYYKE